MSEAKFTKDEWHLSVNGWICAAGRQVARVCSVDWYDSEAEANAHLIAAAPDMYDALEEICAAVAKNNLLNQSVESSIYIGDALKTLAKARGES